MFFAGIGWGRELTGGDERYMLHRAMLGDRCGSGGKGLMSHFGPVEHGQ